MSEANIVQVALNKPLNRCFDYLFTAGDMPAVGCRVEVPFGKQTCIGLVLKHKTSSDLPISSLKPILRIIDQQAILSGNDLALLNWSAEYYHHPIGEAIFHGLPKQLREGKHLGLFQKEQWFLSERGKSEAEQVTLKNKAPKQWQALQAIASIASSPEPKRPAAGLLKNLQDKGLIHKTSLSALEQNPPAEITLRQAPLTLSAEQQLALHSLAHQGFKNYLLQGVTGSGKTEVYLQYCQTILSQGKQVLILVPEIGLTPQTLKRFEERFNCPVACLHSGIADGARAKLWLQCASAQARILIGTRSAVFTPMPNLGAIIVDEEHDGSYKQQEGFRYSGRDLAIFRAQQHNIPVLLGSATPSLESLQAVSQRKAELLTLKQRPGGATMPNLELIDLQNQKMETGLSPSLLDAIQSTLDKQQQALLFINRRGYAPSLRCNDCGWVANCRQCSASFTFHNRPARLHCHHCDTRAIPPRSCPQCQSTQIEPLGQGTERLEESLQAHFPSAPIYRVDRDSISRKGAMQALYDKLNTGEPCILLGTQMLAKGHHFPNVTLAGIIDVDSGLFAGDFRATERMGQLITQVRGRAGRGQLAGHVFLQTHYPEHPLIQQLAVGDYTLFANHLLATRHAALLPPFNYMAIIRANDMQADLADNVLRQLYHYLQQHNSTPAENDETSSKSQVSILGPWPSLMERRNNRYRFELQLKSASRRDLHQQLFWAEQFFSNAKLPRSLRWHIDVDPQDMS